MEYQSNFKILAEFEAYSYSRQDGERFNLVINLDKEEFEVYTYLRWKYTLNGVLMSEFLKCLAFKRVPENEFKTYDPLAKFNMCSGSNRFKWGDFNLIVCKDNFYDDEEDWNWLNAKLKRNEPYN